MEAPDVHHLPNIVAHGTVFSKKPCTPLSVLVNVDACAIAVMDSSFPNLHSWHQYYSDTLETFTANGRSPIKCGFP